MVLPEVKERLETLGFEAVANSSDEMAKQIQAEVQIWGKVIRAANIRPQ
jgi:tripartite-type tricarboxylate transporter receptor subunit TctC